MPSPVGHFIGGVAAGWLVSGAPGTPSRADWRTAGVFGVLGMLPDLDLLIGEHRGPSHSIGAAVIVGALVWIVQSARVPRRQSVIMALACTAAYASHVLLDWLGTDTSIPTGIMALWPFSREHYESSLHLFMATSRRYRETATFLSQNLMALTVELAILLPVLAGVRFLRPRRQTG